MMFSECRVEEYSVRPGQESGFIHCHSRVYAGIQYFPVKTGIQKTILVLKSVGTRYG